MEHQRLDAELPTTGPGQLPLDHREIPVVDVHRLTLDPLPGSPVENPATPSPDLENLPGPADVPQ